MLGSWILNSEQNRYCPSNVEFNEKERHKPANKLSHDNLQSKLSQIPTESESFTGDLIYQGIREGPPPRSLPLRK